MKFQKLTIHNIASIEDAEINFEATPLSSSDVFLITGKTGSGKSTILDAICLSLYETTPRLDNSHMQGSVDDAGKPVQLKNPSQLLRDNTGEGFVRLSFIGLDGMSYEAEWGIKRAHGLANGRLQSRDWKITNLTSKESYTTENDVKAVVANAVGLTFDQFCRTTLLAQGQFTRFLDSEDKDKAEILEKITGADMYSKIGAKVYMKAQEKERAYNEVNDKITGINLLSDDEMNDLQMQIKEVEKSISDQTAMRDSAKDKVDWLQTEAQLCKLKKDALVSLKEAESKTKDDDFLRDKDLINRWKETVNVRVDLQSYDNEKNNAEMARKSITQNKDSYSRIISGLAFLRQEKEIKDRALQECDEKMDHIKSSLPDAERVILADADAIKTQELINTLTKEQGAIKLASEKIKYYRIEQENRRTEDLVIQEECKQIEGLRIEKEAKAKEVETLKNIREAAESSYEAVKYAVDNLVVDIRSQLKVGEICPVCMREITDAIPSNEAIEEHVAPVRRAFEEAKQKYEKSLGQFNAINAKFNSDSSALKRREAAFKTDEKVTKAKKAAQDALNDLGILDFANDVEKELENRMGHNEDLIAKLKEYGGLLRKKGAISLELAGVIADIDNVADIVSGIEEIAPEWKKLAPIPAQALEGIGSTARNLGNHITREYWNENKAIQASKEADERIQSFLIAHPSYNIEMLHDLSHYSSETIQNMEDDLKKKTDAVLTSQGALSSLDEQIADHNSKRPVFEEGETEETLAVAKEAYDQGVLRLAGQKSGLEKLLSDDESNKKAAGDLAEQAKILRSDRDLWDRLNQMIGDATGNKFRRIAQSYVLGSLVQAANTYMKELTDRYTLKVVPGTFVIMLEDAWMGYSSRPASTISGGETFLVSLSLALALSDIGDGLSVDTMFIDEGFGTLSGEPLQNAVNTLKTLHTKGGRHVGIISHIEELQEKIPVKIKVDMNVRTGGSSVEVVSD